MKVAPDAPVEEKPGGTKKWLLAMAAAASSEALVRGLYDAFNARRLDHLESFLDPQFVDHTPGDDQAPGPEGVKAVWLQIWARMPDVQVAVEEIVADTGRVAVRLSFRYTSSDGLPRTGRGFEFLHVLDGRVTALWNLLRFS